jgi:ABC-type phosphate/phosphonate transport system ATPase subunit
VAGFADRVLGLRDGRIVLDMAGAGFDEGRHGEVYGERARGAYPLP